MNLKRLIRQIHYWLSLIIIFPSGVIIAAGIILMLKKELSWIQPPTAKGHTSSQIPNVSYAQIIKAAQSYPETQILEWSDIKRIDIRPSKGIAKIQSKTGWEIQMDTSNADVLNIAYRRSDLIESLHDGSFFAEWVKLYIFLPTGIILLILWGTGIYLFLVPQLARRKKNAKSGKIRKL